MDPRGILKAFPKQKKIHANPSSKAPAKIPKREDREAREWLSSLRAHVMPTGIGRARAELFEKQIVQHGGHIDSAQAPGVPHIVVNDGMDWERALCPLDCPQALSWKSQPGAACAYRREGYSIRQTRTLLLELVRLCSGQPTPTRPASPPQRPEAQNTQAPPGSDDETNDRKETQVSAADLESLISGHYPIPPEGDGEPSPAPEGLDKWVCAQPSSQKVTNHNTHITEKLEVLAKAYNVQGDKWRARGYAKAINALKSVYKPVPSSQEA
ncbi:hypothetical protein QTO34_009284 [Cnephaeus nilssonii]|uniref:Uncharacterized protein n=1 Tax=Cnephaeus nilssonii TaxID=3371016 RepID=A0AA40HHK3_CNENI|nr:hypothetical protein QTO34_009284 [Eptesicus nilssonii]